VSEYALIVEDNGAWHDLFARAVERVGLQPISALTAQRAIELARRRRYAIVLLDPDLDSGRGVYDCTEVLAELKKAGIETPTILISAHSDAQELTIRAMQTYTMLRYFSKNTVSLLEVDRAIREMTQIRAPTRQHEADLQDFVDGIDYGFAFMSVDLVGHSALYSYSRGPDIDQTLDAFEQFIEENVNIHHGHILSWQGDGGLAAFVAGDKIANCGEAALSILYSLRRFNDNYNKSQQELKVRIACHGGIAKYRSSYGRIHSAAINFVCHLQSKATRENAISLSQPFHEEMNEKSRGRFIPKGEFEGASILEHFLVDANQTESKL
jgi:class 3 adenylate cyclase